MKKLGLVPGLILSLIATAMLCSLSVRGGWLICLPILAALAMVGGVYRRFSV